MQRPELVGDCLGGLIGDGELFEDDVRVVSERWGGHGCGCGCAASLRVLLLEDRAADSTKVVVAMGVRTTER
jgi:hypothetical protein